MTEASGADWLFEAVRTRIASGYPWGALDQLVAGQAGLKGDARLYRLGFEALSAAVLSGPASDASSSRTTFYRQIISQEGCTDRPLIFHHGVASLLTADDRNTAQAITAEVMPVLREMIGSGPPELPVLQFLLVARSCLPKGPERAAIRRWHQEAFPHFAASDLVLPYNVMFQSEGFGPNRRDLLAGFPTAEAIRDPAAGLGLRHVLLLDWLGAADPFPAQDNGDLLEMLSRCLSTASGTDLETEQKAARSLILRHWRPSGALGPAEAEALGLGTEIVEVAGQIQVGAPQATSVPAQNGSDRLERRAFQALAAGRILAARHAPFLARPDRGLRIAVCVSGQLRGYRTAYASWQRYLLGDVAHDIFVHSWQKTGRAGAQPFRKVLPFEGRAFCDAWRHHGMLEGYETLQALYPTLFSALETGGRTSEAELRAVYGARSVVLDDEDRAEFAGYTNQDKMHFKIWAAHKLAVESGEDYDLILRIRPDFGVRMRAFAWRDIADACRGSPVLWTDHVLGVHYGNPMIGDQIALGAPAAMEIYASAWKVYPDLAGLGLIAAEPSFVGHVSLAQTIWLNRLRTRRLPLRTMGLMEAEHLPAKDILQALERDATGRQNTVDRALLQAIREDLR